MDVRVAIIRMCGIYSSALLMAPNRRIANSHCASRNRKPQSLTKGAERMNERFTGTKAVVRRFAVAMVPFYALVGPALVLLGLLLIVISQTTTIPPLVLAGHSPSLRIARPTAPPNRGELGRSGWTLIHAIAANYPEKPTQRHQEQARRFFEALGTLYPCQVCRDHFDRFVALRPPDTSSRESLLLWTCAAHNEVNVRNGKPAFPCNVKGLDMRWGDCGCSGKSVGGGITS